MKFSIKSFVAGILVATIGITSVFAASTIKSAEYNSNKVVFNGKELNLSANPMISIVNEGESNFTNYMPVRAILEQMGYVVDWEGSTNTVYIKTPLEIAKAIVGSWTCDEPDSSTTLKYYFKKDGSFQAYVQIKLTNGEAMTPSIKSGTYTVEGNTVHLSYNDELMSKSSFDVTFAENGNSWSSYVEISDELATFTKDADKTAAAIVGSWVCDEPDDETTLKYYFTKDGHFQYYVQIILTNGEVMNPSITSGTYTVEGNTINLSYDDELMSKGSFDVIFDKDSNSWSSYIEIIDESVTFVKDSDTSWIK